MPLVRSTYVSAGVVVIAAMLVVWGRYPLLWWYGIRLPNEPILLGWASIYAEPLPIFLSAWDIVILPAWAYATFSVAFGMLMLRRAYLFARHGIIPAAAYSWFSWLLAVPVWIIWAACVYIGFTLAINDGRYDALAGLIVASSGMLLAPAVFILEVASLRHPDRF